MECAREVPVAARTHQNIKGVARQGHIAVPTLHAQRAVQLNRARYARVHYEAVVLRVGRVGVIGACKFHLKGGVGAHRQVAAEGQDAERVQVGQVGVVDAGCDSARGVVEAGAERACACELTALHCERVVHRERGVEVDAGLAVGLGEVIESERAAFHRNQPAVGGVDRDGEGSGIVGVWRDLFQRALIFHQVGACVVVPVS